MKKSSINLDENQKKAVFLSPLTSAIIEAPPGYGKTFVMARRIEYILQSGFIIAPQKILGLTFSNSAAGEMLDDIRVHLHPNFVGQVKVMTFHSFCHKVLRSFGNVAGISRNFDILVVCQS